MAAAAAGNRYAHFGASSSAKLYAEVETAHALRLSSGIGEFDRVLGGGIVPGSLVLLGGEPGIGKSTLLLQAAAHFASEVGPVLYASGEESEHQIKSRGDRLGVGDTPLYLLSETCIERILEEIARLRPALVIIDSIQTVFSLKFQSAPGSIGQVREAATQFLFAAKGQNIPTVLVGHVTKDGDLAGPKALEHVVDTVLYFEGERHHSHRIVRAIKNRFGAVSELGVFEMTGTGLKPVANPSRLFLSERASGTPGSAVLCCLEGSRPFLVEVQALVSTSTYGNARRMAIGIDQNRLSLLLAVLEKRAGLSLAGDDVYVNIAGGMSIEEPAADLSVVAAVASSVRNRGLSPSTAVFGEVGLSGEIRGIPQAPLRIREASQLGFTRVVLPAANMDRSDQADCELVGVRTVGEALDALIA
jgi:DNA repair protein RadA/Sms